MEHNDIRHKLSEYIDGAVTGKEKAAIETHLKTCLQCSGALEELRKTIEHVKTIEEIDPPAWMTLKIMATVRAEAEVKKSIFQRLFYPLTVKLPIQAIAVLFVAVTGFYIYQAIQPASRLSEVPTQEFAARNEASPAGTVQDKLAKADGPAVRSKKVPQTPAYKSLDMKLEYEKPAPPAPMDKAEAPAPTALAKPAEQPVSAKEESASGKMVASPQAGAPAVMREQAVSAEAAPPAEVKQKLERQELNAVSADKVGLIIIVRVKDVKAAAREVEQVIARLGGSITRRENPETKRVYVITINAQKFPDLKKKLKLMGEIKDEAAVPMSQDGRVEVRIELVLDSAQP